MIGIENVRMWVCTIVNYARPCFILNTVSHETNISQMPSSYVLRLRTAAATAAAAAVATVAAETYAVTFGLDE